MCFALDKCDKRRQPEHHRSTNRYDDSDDGWMRLAVLFLFQKMTDLHFLPEDQITEADIASLLRQNFQCAKTSATYKMTGSTSKRRR